MEPPSTPIVTVVNNCGSTTLSTTATGVLLWSNGAMASSITVSTAGTYSVTRTVNGCTSAPGYGTAAPIMTCGNTYPTGTTCSQYTSGTAAPLTQICYTNGANGKVRNATPGVMFYYSSVVAPSANFCVEVVQTKSCSTLRLLHVQQNQADMWNSSCVKVASGTETVYNSTQQVAKICITGATPGARYTISVKYDVKSLIGSPNNTTGCNFTFFTRTVVNNTSTVVPNSTTVLNAYPGCAAYKNEDPIVEPLLFIAYPNPFNESATIEFTDDEASSLAVIELYNTVGEKIAHLYEGQIEAGVKHSVTIDGSNLSNGIYLCRYLTVEGKSRTIRLVLSK